MQTVTLRLRRTIVAALAVLLSAAHSASAELPPEAYLRRQKVAPEALRVRVVSVKKNEADSEKFKTTIFTVEARVLEVERTATHLKAGDVIQIVYVTRQSKVAVAGPAPVPILDGGREYPAFLSKNGTKPYYIPAAGAWSFGRLRGERK